MALRRRLTRELAVVLLSLAGLVAGLVLVGNPFTSSQAGRGRVVSGSSAPGRLLVVGDSFTVGYAAAGNIGYAQRLVTALGWPHTIDGVGGTGFVYPGRDGTDRSYRRRLESHIAAPGPAPTLVLLQGGLNDYRSSRHELAQAVSEELGLVRHAWPAARIVMFGPLESFAHSNELAPLNATLAEAAVRAGVDYVDPLGEGWITAENSGRYVISDGTHPNTAGHAYLTDRLLADLRSVGAVP